MCLWCSLSYVVCVERHQQRGTSVGNFIVQWQLCHLQDVSTLDESILSGSSQFIDTNCSEWSFQDVHTLRFMGNPFRRSQSSMQMLVLRFWGVSGVRQKTCTSSAHPIVTEIGTNMDGRQVIYDKKSWRDWVKFDQVFLWLLKVTMLLKVVPVHCTDASNNAQLQLTGCAAWMTTMTMSEKGWRRLQRCAPCCPGPAFICLLPYSSVNSNPSGSGFGSYHYWWANCKYILQYLCLLAGKIICPVSLAKYGRCVCWLSISLRRWIE